MLIFWVEILIKPGFKFNLALYGGLKFNVWFLCLGIFTFSKATVDYSWFKLLTEDFEKILQFLQPSRPFFSYAQLIAIRLGNYHLQWRQEAFDIFSCQFSSSTATDEPRANITNRFDADSKNEEKDHLQPRYKRLQANQVTRRDISRKTATRTPSVLNWNFSVHLY